MTARATRRSARPIAAILATLGLLAGMVVPGVSLAADPSASAPAASASPAASSGPSTPVPSDAAAASTTPSTSPAPSAASSPAPSPAATSAPAAQGAQPQERPDVPEIFNPANPNLLKPALTGVLPAGFQEQTVFSGLTQPTNIQFAPNGKIFVAQKTGIILEYDSLTDTTPVTFADLSQEVMDYWDRGLLSMAIDPGLTTGRPYIYVLYSFDAPIGGNAPTWGGTSLQDSCPTPPGANPPNTGCVISGRLSRLTVSGNGTGNTMTAGSEKVLINAWCQQYPSHSIGTVMMGPDGQLWVTGGEGAAFTTRDYGQYTNPCGDPPSPAGTSLSIPTAEGGSLRAQDALTPGDPQGLSGSLIRVDPDTGAASVGNPDYGNTDPNLARILAYGLRNPFRFTLRPGTNEPWIGMVGNVTWESIFRDPTPLAGQLNFGWPCYEGPALNDFSSLGLNMCKTLYNNPSLVTKPYYAYNHSASIVAGDGCTTGSSSISGLAFGVGTAFPSQYTNGGLFFSDYSRNCIWYLPAGANGLPDASNPQIFETNATGPVSLVFGPDGNLYYSDFGGSIRRIIYSATNHTPVASFTASATYGPTPLTVNFDASASIDADPGDTLSYSWDLNGDGVYGDATGVTTSKTYTTRGDVVVSVKVTDNHGAASTSSITIFPGDTPPVVTINSPTGATTWKVGDIINMSATATDSEDGTLPASAYSWSIILHHCYTLTNCHVHDLTGVTGPTGQLVAPDHGYPSNLEFDLTVTDSDGMSVTKTVTSYPQTVNLTFLTNPSGLQVSDGDSGPNVTTPITRPVIIGSTVSVSAPTPQVLNGFGYAFASWSDGGGQSHDIIAPATAATYTATFTNTGSSALASDAFNRTAGTGGWGTADVGGAWAVNPAAQFALTGSGGTISSPTAGKTGSALVPVSARDVDVTVQVQSDRAPTGNGQYPAIIVRHQAGGQEYWVKVHISATGQIFLGASAWSGTAETAIGAEVNTTLTQTLGVPINVRVEASGASPTTITARAWLAGTTEPTTWKLSVTDSTAALQNAGSLGLRATTSGSTTNSPTLFTFDGFVANTIGGTTPPPPPTTIATDTFTRTVTNGWGTATTGGPWTTVGTNTAFATDGSGGTIKLPTAGSPRSGLLAGASAQNLDETFTVASYKVVVGSGQYAFAILRHQAGGAEYWGKIHFSASGAIFLNASAYSGTAETVLGPEVASGLTRVQGTAVNVRFQVIGTSPTTIRGRAWAVGSTEPTTWTFTDTDSTAALQHAGTVGLRATTSSTSTNVPITFRFDNLTVLDLGAGATPSTSQVRSDPFGPRVPVAVVPAGTILVPTRRTGLTTRTATVVSGRNRATAR